MLDNPMSEMRHIWTVRSHLDNEEFPFKASYDLTTKKVHFYTNKDYAQNILNSEFKDLTNESISDSQSAFEKEGFQVINLNENHDYVRENIIIENDEESLTENSSITTITNSEYVFVPNELIYDHVAKAMGIDA